MSALAVCRSCCTCRVVQCLCCSLPAGVLTLASILFINACLAFSGEAMLVFDMGQAVVTTLAGNFLPPGTKLEGTKVHGGLIVAGLFSLISSLAGFWAVCRRSLRAASLFFISTTLGAVIGLALLVTTWMTGSIGISTVLANAPGIVLMVYLCVVTNSFRMGLKQSAAGALSCVGVRSCCGIL